MKKVYRAHPLMLLSKVKPFLLIFILPVVKAFLQYIIKGRIIDIIGVEITFFVIVTIIAAIQCFRFKLIIDEDTITVKSGFVFRKTARIKFSRLSSIQVQQNPLDKLCRAVTYSINTEAGSRNRSDFRFKLSLKSSKEIYNLIYKDSQVAKFRFSPLKVAVMAATTSSAAMGLLIGVPIVYRAGNLLGLALSDMLLNEINNVSNKIETYFPPIVNTVSLIFLLAYGVSFVYTLAKYINFKLKLGENSLEVRTGLFVRSSTVFKKRCVNNVKIEQTPLMHLVKRFAMKVSVGGFGEKKAVSQIIVPSGKWEEIENEFNKYFPFLSTHGNTISSKRGLETQSRFLFWPAVYLGLVLLISFVLAQKYQDFGKLILFLTLVAVCAVFYHAYTSLYEYKHGKLSLGDNVYARSIKRFNTFSLYCPKENVGQIKITRFWLDFKKNTCKVKITVCSERADSTRVRLLDYEQVVEEISDCFNVQV